MDAQQAFIFDIHYIPQIKTISFLLHSLYYYLFPISFPPGPTPLFSHRMRIIVPQYTATFITYGPYYLFKLFNIVVRPQDGCQKYNGMK